MTKILIADDHAVVCKGLLDIITEAFDKVLVDKANSGEEALRKAWSGNYDLVVLDISLPDKSGMDVLKEFMSHSPPLPVLMLSMHPEEQYAIAAIRAGASGYLTKGSTAEELVSAIRKILSGGRYISSSLAEHLAFNLGVDAEKPILDKLSSREFEIMKMIASGNTAREIAEKLSVSMNTVYTHRYRILRKMKIKNNVDLTHYALKNNLVG